MHKEISTKLKVRRSQNCLGVEIEGNLIILNTSNGIYFELNPTAKIVWELIEKESEIEKIIDHIISEYEIDEQLAEKEILNFIKKSIEQEIIKVTSNS